MKIKYLIKDNWNNRDVQSGFTLVEVVVALAILAIIMGGMLTLFTHSYQTIYRTSEMSREILNSQSDINNAVLDDGYRVNVSETPLNVEIEKNSMAYATVEGKILESTTGNLQTVTMGTEIFIERPKLVIDISNRGKSNPKLMDHQVLITVNTSQYVSTGEMKSDCGDIRFFDTLGNPLAYYIEPGTANTTNTKIWVKVKEIPASTAVNPETKIEMHYGNKSLLSTSSGFETFDFFDDFRNSSLDITLKWSAASFAGGAHNPLTFTINKYPGMIDKGDNTYLNGTHIYNYEIVSNILKIKGRGGDSISGVNDWNVIRARAAMIPSQKSALEINIKKENYNNHHYAVVDMTNSHRVAVWDFYPSDSINRGRYRVQYQAGGALIQDNSVNTPYSLNTNHTLGIIRRAENQFEVRVNDTSLWTRTESSWSSITMFPVLWTVRGHTSVDSINWVRLRKWVANTPDVTVNY